MDNFVYNIFKYLCYCNRYNVVIDVCCFRDDMEIFVLGDEIEVMILLFFIKWCRVLRIIVEICFKFFLRDYVRIVSLFI